MHDKFNCITVNFDRTQHSIYKVINIVLKIATLNLCLGLKFKKDLVKEILINNDIDILSMQETEIEVNFDLELLNIPGYNFEAENGDQKKRVGMYINSELSFR